MLVLVADLFGSVFKGLPIPIKRAQQIFQHNFQHHTLFHALFACEFNHLSERTGDELLLLLCQIFGSGRPAFERGGGSDQPIEEVGVLAAFGGRVEGFVRFGDAEHVFEDGG